MARLGTEWQACAPRGDDGVGPVPEAAQGPTALAALARWRAGQRVPLSGTVLCPPDAPPLQALPLNTLSAARVHAPVLARLGLRTWGQLCRLPRDGVARRWGGALLAALDQGLGRHPEAHRWLSPPQTFDQTLALPHALDSATALMPWAQALLQHLLGWLRMRQRGVLTLRWQWQHDARRDVPELGGLDIRTAQPTQSADHLLRLTREHLARQSLDAPVVALRLLGLDHAPMAVSSTDWLHPVPADGTPCLTWTALTERLAARLGAAALMQWQPHSDHRAEHTQQSVLLEDIAEKSIQKSDRADFYSDFSDRQLWPTWLLPTPRALAVRGHRPCHQGELQLLAGPQRLELTHWPGADVAGHTPDGAGVLATVRDYFVARSPGAGLVWVFRLPAGERWFLHGVFA